MLRLLLAGALVVGLPTVAAAGPCGAGSLASYIGLGSVGCSIGGTTLSGFSSAASLAGGTEIDPSAIMVTPSGGGGAFALDFAMNESTGLGVLGVLITYSVLGPGFDTATLDLAGAGATAPSVPGGVVTAVEELCAPAGPGCPPSSIATLIAAQDAVGPVPAPPQLFGPLSFFDVFVDIALDPGLGGTAFLNGSVTTGFAPAAVPEPMLTLLLGSGVAGLVVRQRRRRGSCAD
jgi:hypothetical protein